MPDQSRDNSKDQNIPKSETGSGIWGRLGWNLGSFLTTSLIILLGISMFFFLVGIPVHGFGGARARANYIKCQGNMKAIASALEMYATDHGGQYPARLSQLKTKYMKEMPKCPARARDTYSESYKSQKADPRRGKKAYYFFCCKGNNHSGAKAPPNYPQYDSVRGLIPK